MQVYLSAVLVSLLGEEDMILHLDPEKIVLFSYMLFSFLRGLSIIFVVKGYLI